MPQKTAKKRIRCDQCQMLSINGVPCHETGCPNSRKTWVPERGEWVLFVDCSECGYPVEVGTACGCQQSTEDESEGDQSSYDAECWNCGSSDVLWHSEVVGKGQAHYRCDDCGATGDLTDFMPAEGSN